VGSGVGKKDDKVTRCFLEVILGTFWPMFAVFLVRAKSQNTVIYSVVCAFGMEEILLSTC
jgi:hypothetical protein